MDEGALVIGIDGLGDGTVEEDDRLDGRWILYISRVQSSQSVSRFSIPLSGSPTREQTIGTGRTLHIWKTITHLLGLNHF